MQRGELPMQRLTEHCSIFDVRATLADRADAVSHSCAPQALHKRVAMAVTKIILAESVPPVHLDADEYDNLETYTGPWFDAYKVFEAAIA